MQHSLVQPVLSGVSLPSLEVPLRTGSLLRPPGRHPARESNNHSWSQQEPHLQASMEGPIRWEKANEGNYRDAASLWTSSK